MPGSRMSPKLLLDRKKSWDANAKATLWLRSWGTSGDKWEALHYKEWEWEIHLLPSVLSESKKIQLTLKTRKPSQQSQDEYTPDQMQITDSSKITLIYIFNINDVIWEKKCSCKRTRNYKNKYRQKWNKKRQNKKWKIKNKTKDSDGIISSQSNTQENKCQGLYL